MSTKSLIVVGLKGVGMAHVVAAGRLGYEVVGLVDNNKYVLSAAKKEWCNRWMDLVECTPVQRNTEYFQRVSSLEGLHADLCIVCTPPHTHQEILSHLPQSAADHVICEKPLSYPEPPSPTRPCMTPVSISSEWAYHTELKMLEETEGIKSMEMRYPVSRNTNWGYELPDVFDFTPHFFSILEGFGRTVHDMHYVGDGQYVVETDKGDCVFKEGARSEPFGFFVNNTVFHWQEDLFDLQLAAGCGVVSWERMYDYDVMLRRCVREAA
jgi:hypothetical protein